MSPSFLHVCLVDLNGSPTCDGGEGKGVVK